MSFLHKLFGSGAVEKPSTAQGTQEKVCNCKLNDITLNYCGLEGDIDLKEMADNGQYDALKSKSLELYNLAYDKYLGSRSEEDLNLMYVYFKNNMACQLMWYYHEQIIPLFDDSPEDFIVSLNPTCPFEFPESILYHGKALDEETVVPFVDFYRDLEANMAEGIRFVYHIIPCPQ